MNVMYYEYDNARGELTCNINSAEEPLFHGRYCISDRLDGHDRMIINWLYIYRIEYACSEIISLNHIPFDINIHVIALEYDFVENKLFVKKKYSDGFDQKIFISDRPDQNDECTIANMNRYRRNYGKICEITFTHRVPEWIIMLSRS